MAGLQELIEARSMPEPNSQCWLWLRAVDKNGYGLVTVGSRRDGRKMRRAHRVAYEAFGGLLPEDLCILHRCDTPGCVNPDHLFLGTQADNTTDKMVKGRHRAASGEQHGSKTQPESRARGERHGSRTKPDRVVRGAHHWSRVHPERLPRGERHSFAKVTEARVRQIRADTRPHRVIAAEQGITVSTVGEIKRREIWRHVE